MNLIKKIKVDSIYENQEIAKVKETGYKSRDEKVLSHLQQERAELNELKLQNLQLNEKLLLKDEILNKKDSEIKAIQADRETLFEDVRKVRYLNSI